MSRRFLAVLATFVLTAGQTAAFEWSAALPESQGMDSQPLQALTQRLASGELGQVDGVMVIRGSQVVFEEYFRGYRGQPLPVYSVTKSVGSILMGTLVRDGLLNVSDPINDFFPEYPQLRNDPLRSQITVEHVLQMRHGYAWEEWPYTGDADHPLAVMIRSADWMGTVLTWPMAGPPGEEFKYSTGASGLMSGIIGHATGLTTQAYARRELFTPLGIGEVQWAITHLNQRDAWLDSDDFPGGVAPLGFSLWLSLPDMARIGQLMLNGGVWEGQRIISEAWIEASTGTYSTTLTDPEIFTAPGQGYGYQWWIQPFTDSLGRTFEMYFASGSGRQYILVFPEADLVVVQLAADFTRTGPGIGTALREHILPAIETDPRQFEPMSPRLNGSWYDPDVPGQGLNLEILDRRNEILAYWYTYDADGRQVWLIGQGPIDPAGVAHLEFMVTEGGRPGVRPEPVLKSWGRGELSFESCLSGRLLFDSEDAGLAGEIPLSRLTGAENCNAVKTLPVLP